jgi:hypothetical protein
VRILVIDYRKINGRLKIQAMDSKTTNGIGTVIACLDHTYIEEGVY